MFHKKSISTLIFLFCVALAIGMVAGASVFAAPAADVQPEVLIIYNSVDGPSVQDQEGIAHALDEIGIPYSLFDASVRTVTPSVLRNFSAVVVSEVTLNGAEAVAVRDYVGAGGGLIATGKAAAGLESVLGISSYATKSVHGGLTIRFETAHPVSYGAYWNGPIMQAPPMPANAIPSITQFLYGNDWQPGYYPTVSSGTAVAHWYADAGDWSGGQEEAAIVVNEYGQGRAVYSGPLPGTYAHWQWPKSWRVFIINALEWAAGDDYLVEIGYWPNANSASFVWSGDTEKPDMVAAVPAILNIFEALGLENFGTFYVVGRVGGDAGTKGAKEYPYIVEMIAAAGSEVGGHGDVHTSFDSGNVATDTARLQRMLDIINPMLAPYGESVRGFRAPHVSVTRATFEAAENVGLMYDSSDIDIWSETTLPFFNGNVWQAPPSMPMDWTLFVNNSVSDADATTIYNDKFDYVYARRGMFNWLHHPWIIDGHLSVLQNTLQHALDKGDMWMVRQDHLLNWWRQRSHLSIQNVSRSGHNIRVMVQYCPDPCAISSPLTNATLWLKLPEGANPNGLGAFINGKPLVVRQRVRNGMTFLAAVIPSISAGQSVAVEFAPICNADDLLSCIFLPLILK